MFGLGQIGRLGSVGRALAAWTPAQLWPLGATSPGMWTDPPYTASLFQDSAGTTAISAIGTVLDSANPIGLALDRKGGLALGAELVTNGDFSSVASWVAQPGWTISGGSANSAGGSSLVYQANASILLNHYYEIAFEITNYVSGTVRPYVGATPTYGAYVSGNGVHTFRLTAAINGNEYGFGSSAFVGSVDNFSVKEIPGIHLSQATSAARPVASARKNELLATAVLSTQNVTTTAIPYTISFGGAGTVTASGTHVGALTNGQTFTPTAGTLTLTVAGSVTTAQLERGSAVTSYQRVGATAADYDASAGPTFILFDGIDDSLASATFAAGTIPGLTDCLIAVRRDVDGESIAGLFEVAGAASKWFGAISSTVGALSACGIGAGTPTVWVDNVQLVGGTAVTRGAIATALTVGSWHILEFRGLDLSAWTAVIFGSYGGGYNFNGALGEIQLFASGQDANRDKARAQMAAYFGVTLP